MLMDACIHCLILILQMDALDVASAGCRTDHLTGVVVHDDVQVQGHE